MSKFLEIILNMSGMITLWNTDFEIIQFIPFYRKIICNNLSSWHIIWSNLFSVLAKWTPITPFDELIWRRFMVPNFCDRLEDLKLRFCDHILEKLYRFVLQFLKLFFYEFGIYLKWIWTY